MKIGGRLQVEGCCSLKDGVELRECEEGTDGKGCSCRPEGGRTGRERGEGRKRRRLFMLTCFTFILPEKEPVLSNGGFGDSSSDYDYCELLDGY